MEPFIYILIGVVLGGVIGWLLGASKAVAAPVVDNRLEGELRQQLSQREVELIQLRNQQTQSASALAGAEAKHQAAERLLAEQKELHSKALMEAKAAQDKA
ncbi:MAG: hypothetical protein K0Q55_3913, partial [Verrucomicrobia bacterium]|nr:hypothetical protein [Verrucomicrobiota bacterium]